MVGQAGRLHTYHEPDGLVERGQMGRSYLVMCLHRNMTIGLRMSALGAMMEVHASRRCWLLVMAGHGRR